MTKVVVIGAGSAEFGLNSLAGIMRTEGLYGSQLCLVDINPDKLHLVERAAHRLNKEWESGFDICSSINRRDALPGADFIILCVAINREESWEQDHQLGLKYNIAHYAENGGPGAFAHTCRNLGVILPMLKDIEELCPQAVMLTFTNPLTRINTAVQRYSKINNVGICHGIDFAYYIIAKAMHKELGIDLPDHPQFVWTDQSLEDYFRVHNIAKEKYAVKAAGINHFTWILSAYDRNTGEDVYPLIKKNLQSLPPSFEPLTRRLLDLYGLIPVQGDTHISEYVPFASDFKGGSWEHFDIQLYDFNWATSKRDRIIRHLREIGDGTANVDYLRTIQSERAEVYINSIVHNLRHFEEAVNIPNKGFIPNLPDGSIVEVPGILDGDGVHGIFVGEIPEAIAAICRTQLTIDWLNVKAFVEADRNLIYQMFSIDPMIKDIDVAMHLAEEYIENNREYLPQFFPQSVIDH
jgi:alpha-galactosidase